jgi:hypothetical protein
MNILGITTNSFPFFTNLHGFKKENTFNITFTFNLKLFWKYIFKGFTFFTTILGIFSHVLINFPFQNEAKHDLLH